MSLPPRSYVFVLSVIVKQVFNARVLRTDDVVGAFSGYMLIALLWGRLYALAWMLIPELLQHQPRYQRGSFTDWNTLHRTVRLLQFYHDFHHRLPLHHDHRRRPETRWSGSK